MIKVNDKRSYVRGRAVVSAKEVQWADPTTLASKNWNFLVSPTILSAGSARRNNDGNFDTALTQLRGVRSIEKTICLSKLGFYNDLDGLEMIPVDARVTLVRFDRDGKRHRLFCDSISPMSEHAFVDWPVSGPRSVKWLLNFFCKMVGPLARGY